ncbi:MAG TPA: hypothetical protein VGH84_17005, partial [Steroidobacteraceae bacterium]
MADYYVSSAAWAAIAQFAASGVYTVGNIVRPLTAPAQGHEYAFRCTTAGTASTEPVWPAANNATITTGGATFTNVSGQAAYGWSAAAGTLWAIAVANSSRPAVGDRVFLSSDHSESITVAGISTLTYAFTAAAWGSIQIISVNRAGSVPPVAADALSGAALIANFTGSANSYILEAFCNLYWQGITFQVAGTPSGGASFTFNASGTKAHYLRNCAIVLGVSTVASKIYAGQTARVTLDNTTVQFSNVGSFIGTAGGFMWDLRWINTPSAVLGTVPTTLFSTAAGALLATCQGVDLSAVTGTLVTGAVSTATMAKYLFDSCRIAPGVVRFSTPGTASPAVEEAELVNCFDGTNIISERHTAAGDVTTDQSTTMTGGAQDDVGLFSVKLVSSVRCDPWAMTLDSFWMDVENTTIGSARTATVEIISSA